MIEIRDEYRALRDEMTNLFTRVTVVLVAIFTAYATLVLKAFDENDPARLLLLLVVLSALLFVGNLLILAFYNNIYSIGSYLAVYFEGEGVLWHLRSRDMRILLAKARLGDPIGMIERINEPKTVSVAFFIMFLSVPACFLTRFGIGASPIAFYVLVLLAVIGFWLTWALRRVYSTGAQKWMRRWHHYKQKSIEDGEPTIERFLGT